MTPKAVANFMRKARKLLQFFKLSQRDLAVLDCLVFRCRTYGARQTSIALRQLAKLAGCCKDTVIAALRNLEAAGLIRKQKHRVKVPWGLGLAWRQATNTYEFLAPATESTLSTAYRGQESLTTVVPSSALVDNALERLRKAVLDHPVDFPQ